MDNNIKKNKRIDRAVTFALLALLIALSALAFFFAERAPSRTASARTVDADAAYALNAARAYADSHDFSTKVDGTIKARAFGIPYSQKVCGSREKRGGNCVEIAESSSAFVKAALRKESDCDSYKITLGKFKGKTATYGDPTEYTYDEFVSAYGKPNVGLVKYELDGAVISSECLGDGVFSYTLDPSRATRYCRNEIKSSLGGKSFPQYESIELILHTDGERPVTVTVREKFRIDKFGGTSCTAEYNETFDFDVEN